MARNQYSFVAQLGQEMLGPCLHGHAALNHARLIMALVVASCYAAAIAHAQCTPRWQSGSDIVGVSGQIHSIAAWDRDGAGPNTEDFIVAGQFDAVGSIFTSNIAAFDMQRERWFALGEGLQHPVVDVVVSPLGIVMAACIAQVTAGVESRVNLWTGTTWEQVGSTFAGSISQLAYLPNGSLIAVGAFEAVGNITARNAAIWDGTRWSEFAGGAHGPTSTSRINCVYIDAAGALFIGGEFTSVGGTMGLPGAVAARSLAKFSNGIWISVPGSFENVTAIGEFGAGRLVVGGESSAQFSQGFVSLWDGREWQLMEKDILSVPREFFMSEGGTLLAAFQGRFNAFAAYWQQEQNRWQLFTNTRAIAALDSGEYAIGSSDVFFYQFDPLQSRNANAGIKWAFMLPHPSGTLTREVYEANTEGFYSARTELRVDDAWVPIELPLFTLVPAGFGSRNTLFYEDSFAWFQPAPRSFAYRLRGDSLVPLPHAGFRAFTSMYQELDDGSILGVGYFSKYDDLVGRTNYNCLLWPSLLAEPQPVTTPLTDRIQSIGEPTASGLIVYGDFGIDPVSNQTRWLGVWTNQGVVPLPPEPARVSPSARAVSPDGLLHSISSNGMYRWSGQSWERLADVPFDPWTLSFAPNGDPVVTRVVIGEYTTDGSPHDLQGKQSLLFDRTAWTTTLTRFHNGRWRDMGINIRGLPNSVVFEEGRVLLAGDFSSVNGVISACYAEFSSACSCDSVDFNNDGLFPSDEDFIELVSVLAGRPCAAPSCGDIDINNDGVFPSDDDLVTFLRLASGGTCEP